jgi:catechol 2,3-dioxygenase-like lactoylglutathione lyase family enzyme
MEIDLFAGIAVSDFDRAVEWFEQLLGEPAAFEANDTDWVWTLAARRHLYVQRRPERAGSSIVTVFLDDLDGFVEAAAARGVHPDSRDTYDNGVRKVIYLDPEGNEIGFGGAAAEDPADG